MYAKGEKEDSQACRLLDKRCYGPQRQITGLTNNAAGMGAEVQELCGGMPEMVSN